MNAVVQEFLSNKKLEEIPTVVESLLSKVVEECELRVLIQHEIVYACFFFIMFSFIINDTFTQVFCQTSMDRVPNILMIGFRRTSEPKSNKKKRGSRFLQQQVVPLTRNIVLSHLYDTQCNRGSEKEKWVQQESYRQVYRPNLHPPLSTHSALLTLHLKRLKSKGVLVMDKKSYKFARSYASSHPTQPKCGRPRKPNPEQPQSLEARNNAKRMLVALGLENELANFGVKKRGLGLPPKDSAMEEQATSDSDDLRRKLRYFQSKVRESLVPIKGIIQELETLMDLN
ncbi:histone H1-like [Senna tora]|uniref:Histone H1-like n=1 Tax=Senna tora TaxID=362788 RepID=A0A835C8F3_9FABA|nr:histone H1-like [Senna tora]